MPQEVSTVSHPESDVVQQQDVSEEGDANDTVLQQHTKILQAINEHRKRVNSLTLIS